MKRIWNIVLTIAAAALGFGIVCLLVGSFTGGSVDRMIELIFGGREGLDLVLDLLKSQLGGMF